jgi:hypothetical protein
MALLVALSILTNPSEHLISQFFLFAGYWLIAPLQPVGFVFEVGQVRRPEENIRSGYPLSWFCKDDRGIGIPAMRFRAVTDLGTNLTMIFSKTCDTTIFPVISFCKSSPSTPLVSYPLFQSICEEGRDRVSGRNEPE